MQTHHTFRFSSEALKAMYQSYSIQMDYRNPDTDPLWFDTNEEPISIDLLSLYFQQEPVMFNTVAIPCIHFAIDDLGYSQSLFTNLI